MKYISLFESYKSQKELEILTQEIMKKVSEKLFENYTKTKEDIDRIPYIWISSLDLKYESRMTLKGEYDEYKEIKDFIKNSNTWVYFNKSNKPNIKAQFYYDNHFLSRKIQVFLTEDFF